jgi:hypothetical protein
VFFQRSEIDDHAGFVDRLRTDIDFDFPVMAVEGLTGPLEFSKLVGSREMGDDLQFIHGCKVSIVPRVTKVSRVTEVVM